MFCRKAGALKRKAEKKLKRAKRMPARISSMRIQSHVERIKFLTKAAEEQEARRKEAAEKEVATV